MKRYLSTRFCFFEDSIRSKSNGTFASFHSILHSGTTQFSDDDVKMLGPMKKYIRKNRKRFSDYERLINVLHQFNRKIESESDGDSPSDASWLTPGLSVQVLSPSGAVRNGHVVRKLSKCLF